MTAMQGYDYVPATQVSSLDYVDYCILREYT